MRSPRVEALYLSDVEERAYQLPQSWKQRVRSRLDQGAREYGDDSYRLPTQQLLDEIEQEALDLAAWASITITGLDRRYSCPEEAKDHLIEIGAHAVKVCHHIERLREMSVD